MSPIARTSGWPGQRQVRFDQDAAGFVDLAAALLGERPASAEAVDPGGPDHGARGDPPRRLPALRP